MATQIHPTAVVADSATIGQDAVIAPYAVIEDDVVIGDRTRVDSFATVKRFTTMGADNHVHSSAVVGGEPQDLKFHGEETRLEIGDGNRIREFVTIHRGTEAGGSLTKVGDRNLLMAYVHVAHDCILGSDIVMSNASSLAGHVEVGNHAIIAGMSGVHQFVRIGDHSFLGGMSGLLKDLPPFMLASGARATLRGPNSVGLRRMRLTQEAIAALRQTYKRIWRSEVPRQEALDEVEYELGSFPEVQAIVDFVRGSERGTVHAPKPGQEDE